MIRERKGKYQVRVYGGMRNGKRWHLTATVATYTDAKDKERELEREVRQGRSASAATLTVAKLCEQWLRESGPDLSPKTLQEYRGMLTRHVTPAIGNVKIGKLTTARLDEFYAHLRDEKGLSGQSVEHVHGFLRRALNVAIRKGYLTRNPAMTAERPKVKRVQMKPPDPDALKAFLAGLDDDLAVYCRLAAIAGCRRGEQVALRWSDLDGARLTIERAVVEVVGEVVEKSTKTEKVRVVTLDVETVKALNAHRIREQSKARRFGVAWSPTAPMFTTDPGKPWRPDLASHRFRRAAKKAGLDCRLHDLRHWSVTFGLYAGHSVAQVGGRAGHSDASTTLRRYAHAVPSGDEALAASLAALLDG